MNVRKSGSRVLWYESIGFASIIFLSWINELLNLARYFVGGAPHTRDFRGSMVLTIVVLIIWLAVLRLTARLLDRLHYLEGMLRVCAWCRKIGHNNQWMQIEQYFSEGFQIETTHGMCPDCLKKMEHDTAEWVRPAADPSASDHKAEAA